MTDPASDQSPQTISVSFVLPARRFIVLTGSALALGMLGTWLALVQPWHFDPNPFRQSLVAATKFPLYYPTKLPDGFKVDRNLVTTPQDGVVMLTLVGPHGTKMYMTEEARPPTFDLGGFYKQLVGLREVPVGDGAVAVGRYKGGRTTVASRANNKTWILANTNASVSQDQMLDMLKSLTEVR